MSAALLGTLHVVLSDETIESIAQRVARILRAEMPALSKQEAAAQLDISIRTLDRMISTGRIRAEKLGTRTVVPRQEVDRLLSGQGAT